MLSLDIIGAFDKVNHERLIHNLRYRRILYWTTAFIAFFLKDRETTIAIPGYESSTVRVVCGIPQGSTISPILFLFFTASILEGMEYTEAVGFVDDTYLIVISNSTKGTCEALGKDHDSCLRWAVRHGAKFAPKKYKVIHFTRGRKSTPESQRTPNIPSL